MGDFRHGLDQPVGALQQLTRRLRRQPRQCRGHVQQIPFVQRRQEFPAQFGDWPQRTGDHQQRHHQGQARPTQHRLQRRLIELDQAAIERVTLLIRNAPTNPVAHQHRDQGHRQTGGRRHGVGLGVGQRAEQPTFLGLQGEHRNERQRDDQQAEKQRRTDLYRRVGHDLPVVFALEFTTRIGVMPGFDFLVGVFDHYHRRIDHRADGNRDAAQGHDVGVDALETHDDKSDQHPNRQRDDRHQGRTQVP